MSLVIVVLAAALGVGVPVLGIRMLVPSLESGRTAENYRGRRVFAGLGVVWLIWAGAAILGGGAALWLVEGSRLGILTLAALLALVAFSLGLFDDAYGTATDRGFRGHVKAAATGRLTTGGMKLVGISLASWVSAFAVGIVHRDPSSSIVVPVLGALPAGAAIALTANLVNLTDLRPGRALKSYSLLAIAGLASFAFGVVPHVGDAISAPPGADIAAVALFLAGPVLATWRYDLGERGMMGDAGANAAGAVAGLLIVAGLPPVGVGAYLAAILAMNVASEKYSFSRAIEKSSLLTRLDMLGRVQVGPEDESKETDVSPEGSAPSRIGENP